MNFLINNTTFLPRNKLTTMNNSSFGQRSTKNNPKNKRKKQKRTLQEKEKKQDEEKIDAFHTLLDNHESTTDAILQRRHATKKFKSNFKKKSTTKTKSKETKTKGYRSEKEKSFVKRKDRDQYFCTMNDFVSDTFQYVLQSKLPLQNYLLEFLSNDARWITIKYDNGHQYRLSSTESHSWAYTMYNRYHCHVLEQKKKKTE